MSSGDKKLVLIVDDIKANRMLLASIISENTDYRIHLASDGRSVLSLIDQDLPDIILLDIMMPGMDGFEVASILKSRENTKDIPILFITAITEVSGIVKAFDAGGVDYITKPFNKVELLARLKAHISLKSMQDELKFKNSLLADRELHLKGLVDEKTRKIEQTTRSLVTALENANLYNDTDTGNHITRVSKYSALLAELCGCDNEFVKKIRLYASLHDVGKVGLPDVLLKKPGAYTKDEFEQMKDHVNIGGRMLNDVEIDRMAYNIAFFHHEKWDGTGYVSGISGEDIPIEARIVTLADVYDALGTARPYKDPFPEEKINSIIKEGRATHFDPALVDIYFAEKERFLEIKYDEAAS